MDWSLAMAPEGFRDIVLSLSATILDDDQVLDLKQGGYERKLSVKRYDATTASVEFIGHELLWSRQQRVTESFHVVHGATGMMYS